MAAPFSLLSKRSMWSGHIFISHAFKDETRVEEICRLLEERGVRCWIARRDARLGYNYGEEIIEAIDTATALLVIVSQHCNESEHVPREVQLALSGHKPVLPVRIESVEPSRQLGYYLSIKQWIDLSAPPTNAEIERLVAAIRTHLERSQETASPETDKQPTRLLAPTSRRPYLRPSLIVASVCAAVVLGLAALFSRAQRDEEARRPPMKSTTALAPEAANTITVIEFVNHRADPSNDWYGKALQNAFDTELSKIPELSVKAPEIIERAARDTGVNPLVVAHRLGVTRYITGSFAVLENTIHIDARIVETASGVQEAAENVEGESRDFFALQKRLALATLDHFRVRLTKAQEATLQQNSRVDKYRKLLEVEGVTETGSSPSATPGEPQTFPGDPHAGLQLCARAYAQASDPEAAALQLLEEYRRAHENGDIDHLATLYVSFPEGQRKALTDYLKDITRLRVELVNVKVEPHGKDLAVSYTRRDKFIDTESGEPVTLEVRVTKFLVQAGGKWKFAEGG